MTSADRASAFVDLDALGTEGRILLAWLSRWPMVLVQWAPAPMVEAAAVLGPEGP